MSSCMILIARIQALASQAYWFCVCLDKVILFQADKAEDLPSQALSCDSCIIMPLGWETHCTYEVKICQNIAY